MSTKRREEEDDDDDVYDGVSLLSADDMALVPNSKRGLDVVVVQNKRLLLGDVLGWNNGSRRWRGTKPNACAGRTRRGMMQTATYKVVAMRKRHTLFLPFFVVVLLRLLLLVVILGTRRVAKGPTKKDLLTYQKDLLTYQKDLPEKNCTH